MNILICPDKFKGSLSAKEVCDAVAEGLLKNNPGVVIRSVPLADGGEGTCDLLTEWYEGSKIELEVHGPLLSPVRATYGLSKDGKTAFIEMAGASGLTLLNAGDRNPLMTTTLGTGELIADAIRRKVGKIILGIGGSATNDAGIGMAQALGYKFLDAGGEALKPTGENLIHIKWIDGGSVDPLLRAVSVITLCDVANPLFGPEGAAYVYGPQKGANQQAVELLDAGLRNFRRVVHKYLKTSVDFPGAGAAGGLGAGAKVFLNASIEKGINYIIQSTLLTEKIREADLVITGEGKIDRQTFSGKVVSEVMTLAGKMGKPVVAICGKCDLPQKELDGYGLKKVIALVDGYTTAESAIEHAALHISRKVMEECKNITEL
ncbi:MAG TPA: glycerate kinase [Chryseosolibacter sp.]|nr:glycerate kinase [Chryseosolibacter sp.]